MDVPLTNLTRKNKPWEWTSECQEAFEKVKHALTNAPVLAPPELGKPFEMVFLMRLHRNRARNVGSDSCFQDLALLFERQ
jgi:hypothetical protein